MIIRIMEQGQFRIEDTAQLRTFEELDDALHQSVQANDNVEFTRVLAQLITHIKANGQPITIFEIIPSDVIVPAEDMTIADAADLLPLTPETPESYPS